MRVNFVFDDDLLRLLVSVDSYHGTQSILRWVRGDETDGRARAFTLRVRGSRCTRLELGNLRRDFMQAVAR